MLLDDLCHHSLVILNSLASEDGFDSLEELSGQLCQVSLSDLELHDRTPRMQRFNDAVLEVASEDEPTVTRVLLHEVTKGWLSAVWVEIVCFVQDDVLTSACERYGRSELEDVVA